MKEMKCLYTCLSGRMWEQERLWVVSVLAISSEKKLSQESFGVAFV